MKQRVLVVDDDKLVADTLSLVFRANGFEAEACYSAAEGLERARTYRSGAAAVRCDDAGNDSGLELAAGDRPRDAGVQDTDADRVLDEPGEGG